MTGLNIAAVKAAAAVLTDMPASVEPRIPQHAFKLTHDIITRYLAGCPADTPMGSCEPRCGDPLCGERPEGETDGD